MNAGYISEMFTGILKQNVSVVLPAVSAPCSIIFIMNLVHEVHMTKTQHYY